MVAVITKTSKRKFTDVTMVLKVQLHLTLFILYKLLFA